jgi:hypothetical protein
MARFDDNAPREKTILNTAVVVEHSSERSIGLGKSALLAFTRNEMREIFGREDIHLDVSSSGDGFVLTVGGISVLFDRCAAEEIVGMLADALEPTDPLDFTTTGSN